MILVTGGTGLVGAHLLYELTSAGNRVKVLRRPQSNTEWVRKIFSYYSPDADFLFEQIEWVEGDILDYLSLEEALKGSNQYFPLCCYSFVSWRRPRHHAKQQCKRHRKPDRRRHS